jgi:hypothetical protein
VPSVTPSEAKTSTQSSIDTTLETKIVSTTPQLALSTTPLLALSTLSENLTIEVTSSEENVSTEKFRETTLNPSSIEESEEETITIGEDNEDIISFPGNSSEELESGEEETTEGMLTTEFSETMEPFNVNLTTSKLGNNNINSLLSNFIDA